MCKPVEYSKPETSPLRQCFGKLDKREVSFLAGVSVVMGFESCGRSRYREQKVPLCRRAVKIMWCDVQYVELQGQSH